MAVVYLSGFEHGLGSANGGGLMLASPSSSNTNIATTAGRVKSGTYSQRINNPGASTIGVRGFFTVNDGGACNGGFWLYLETLPAGDRQLFTVQGTTTEDAVIQYDQGTGKLAAFDPSNGQQGIWSSCPVLSADTWYWIAWKVDRTADSMSLTITPDGGSATDCGSVNGIAWTNTNGWVAIGNDQAQGAFDAYYDDLIICNGATEYPLDPHEVLWLAPGADGTHNVAGTEYIDGDTATTPNFTNSTTDAWTRLDDLPWSATRKTTGNIACEVHSAGTYLEIKPATAASGKPDATAVRALLAYSSVTATANSGSATVIRNSAGTQTDIFGNFTTGVDYSESTNFFKGAIATAPGAGWTKTEIEALRWRIGRASNSSDINPRPTWQELGLEIAYPIASGPATQLGASATALTMGFTTSASRRTFSSSTFPLSVSFTTSGRRAPRGVSTFPLSLTFTTVGHRLLKSSSTFPLSISYTTSGRRAARGFSTFPLSITFTTFIPGIKTEFGVSAFPLTIAYTTQGQKYARGASTFPLTISYTTVGKRTARSASTFPLTISYTSQAKKTAFGASTYPLVISYSSRPASPTGVSTFPLTMSFATSGKVTRHGQSLLPLTLGVVSSARATRFAASAFPLAFTYAATGTRTAHGSSTLPLVFLISSSWRASQIPGDISVGDAGDNGVSASDVGTDALVLVDSRIDSELIASNDVSQVSVIDT